MNLQQFATWGQQKMAMKTTLTIFFNLEPVISSGVVCSLSFYLYFLSLPRKIHGSFFFFVTFVLHFILFNFFLIHYISSPFKMSAWILRWEVFILPKPDYYSEWKDYCSPMLWDLLLQFTFVDSDYIDNNKNDWPLVSLINVLIYIKQVLVLMACEMNLDVLEMDHWNKQLGHNLVRVWRTSWLSLKCSMYQHSEPIKRVLITARRTLTFVAHTQPVAVSISTTDAIPGPFSPGNILCSLATHQINNNTERSCLMECLPPTICFWACYECVQMRIWSDMCFWRNTLASLTRKLDVFTMWKHEPHT